MGHNQRVKLGLTALDQVKIKAYMYIRVKHIMTPLMYARTYVIP